MQIFLIVTLSIFLVVLLVRGLIALTDRAIATWNALVAQIAEETGLPVHSGPGRFDRDVLRGDAHGYTIEFDQYTVSTGKSSTTYHRVRLYTDLDPGLRLHQEGISSAIGKLMLGKDHEIGDKSFDDLFVIRGPAEYALAVLNREARKALHDTYTSEPVLKDQVWTIERVGGHPEVHDVARYVDAMRELAQHLRAPANLVDALANQATSTDWDRVRCKALLALHEQSPQRALLVSKQLLQTTPEAALSARKTTTALAGVLVLQEEGTTMAVPVLRQLQQRSPHLASAIEGAIAVIQDRAGPDVGGRVSLATSSAGGLSQAADRGRITAATDRNKG